MYIVSSGVSKLIIYFFFASFSFLLLQNQFMTSTSSKVAYNTESNIDDVIRSRPASVKFEPEIKIQPIWRPSYESDSDGPQYKPIKPNLTPTGRSSAYSIGQSPIPLNEKPVRFTSTSEQLNEMTTRDYQVLKPKPVPAKPHFQAKSFTNPTQYYTATAGPPLHNQSNIASESSRHMEVRESTECSQRIVNMSSTKRVIQFDQQQHQHQQQQQHHYQSENTIEKQFEPFSYSSVSPNLSNARHKLPPPPTPTKFIPGEFRESDYDSEIESFRIRPIWTPNHSESERIHYRHVSAPTPSRCVSASRFNSERILTPMDFDSGPVEMPTKIQSTPSPRFNGPSPHQFKTQTLDRFRSKKKNSSHLKTTSQDDIHIVHSTPKYSRLHSPSLAFNEESKVSEYGKCFLILLF